MEIKIENTGNGFSLTYSTKEGMVQNHVLNNSDELIGRANSLIFSWLRSPAEVKPEKEEQS